MILCTFGRSCLIVFLFLGLACGRNLDESHSDQAPTPARKNPNFHFFTETNTPRRIELVQVSEAARRDLALDWFGRELTAWSEPLRVKTNIDPQEGAGGSTTILSNGVPQFMYVQGSLELVKATVLPHEIMHTILAGNFGRPMPRWVDEGLCMFIEIDSERKKQDFFIKQAMLHRGKWFTVKQIFELKEYPKDPMHLSIFYAESYRLVRFLIEQKGGQELLAAIKTYFAVGNWPAAIAKHYHYATIEDLQHDYYQYLQRELFGAIPVL